MNNRWPSVPLGAIIVDWNYRRIIKWVRWERFERKRHTESSERERIHLYVAWVLVLDGNLLSIYSYWCWCFSVWVLSYFHLLLSCDQSEFWAFKYRIQTGVLSYIILSIKIIFKRIRKLMFSWRYQSQMHLAEVCIRILLYS